MTVPRSHPGPMGWGPAHFPEACREEAGEALWASSLAVSLTKSQSPRICVSLCLLELSMQTMCLDNFRQLKNIYAFFCILNSLAEWTFKDTDQACTRAQNN